MKIPGKNLYEIKKSVINLAGDRRKIHGNVNLEIPSPTLVESS